MSANDEEPESKQKEKKTYMWFGYGGYSGPWESAAFNPTNIRAAPSLFDKLFEIFGVKDKEDPQENRD